MIEPNGTPVDVLGVPNRQSKVPAFNGGKGQHQDHCVQQAQDDPGFGSLSTAGINDMPASKTEHAMKQAQDGGSAQGAFTGVSGELNLGAARKEGSSPIGGSLRAGTPTESQVDPDPGTAGSDASQAALLANPWLAD